MVLKARNKTISMEENFLAAGGADFVLPVLPVLSGRLRGKIR
jgi:hypothetical protein